MTGSASSSAVRLFCLLLLGIGGCANSGFGESTRRDVERQMATIKAPVDRCYAAALKRDRKLRGTMLVAFNAEMKTGKFSDIAITSSELPDPELQTCVKEQVAGLKLATPTSTRVAVEYPLVFAPTN